MTLSASARHSLIRVALGRVVNLLYPPTCVACGSCGLDGSELLCEPCGRKLERQAQAAYCPTCARTVPPFAVSQGRCHRCRDKKRRIAAIARAGPYTGPLRTMLHALKYQRRWPVAGCLGQLLAAQVSRAPWFESIETLVAVPQWWPRRMFAGDYPPALLARAVSARTGTPRSRGLRRVKGGPSQVGLTEAQRIANVRGKFALARGAGVKGATLCLIDDVMTTGATLDECARVLRKGGVRQVYAAVVAHVSQDTPSLFVPGSEPEAQARDARVKSR